MDFFLSILVFYFLFFKWKENAFRCWRSSYKKVYIFFISLEVFLSAAATGKCEYHQIFLMFFNKYEQIMCYISIYLSR